MNPSEAWVLLTIRSKHFGRVPGGHGVMTVSDVAALLAGLDTEPFQMGMAADCGDLGALKQIELLLWQRANIIAERENWDPPRGEFTVRRMAAVALYEAIDDRRCYVCNGTSEMWFALDEVPGMVMAPTFRLISETAGGVRCPACVNGRTRLSARKKADLAGIHKDMWTRVWARRYEPVFTIANGWRETARQYLAARVREAEEAVVDKDGKMGGSDRELEAAKKTSKIKESCGSSGDRVKSARRTAAPEANVAPKELDFGALQRPILRLNRR